MGVFEKLGWKLATSALATSDTAQSLRDMVYGDAVVASKVPAESMDQRLMNEIYVRRENAAWSVVAAGVERTASTGHQLNGEHGRASGPLATRSVTWVKLVPSGATNAETPCALVLNTHISGGRFEDQYFLQLLADERRKQTSAALGVFATQCTAGRDVGICVGDYNATPTYETTGGPMHGYFKSAIASAPGVQADAQALGLTDEAGLEGRFATYMTSPFAAIEAAGWALAYAPADVGFTSGFGHCIDHMATYGAVKLLTVQREVLTNQLFSKEPPETNLVLTDHNAVKATFRCFAPP